MRYIRSTEKSGFTLIELLIVIALLGTLAVALLAAIDPFEQFKKGTDTGIRNTVQEFFNAGIRYYAQRTGWPSTWGVSPDGSNTVGPVALNSDTASYVDPLVNAGELKSNFVQLAQDQLDDIYMTAKGATLLVCFKPGSKSFQSADKNTKFTSNALDSSGNPQTDSGTTCKLNGGTQDCYWCIY